MTHSFERDYWQQHWDEAETPGMLDGEPNPHLIRETQGLTPGTAIDAGCGTGTEAIWLATQGWRVTGADISATALGHARQRAEAAGVVVEWVEADLTEWQPPSAVDLVVTHYAHPAIAQLEFYDRIARWVAPGGSLLIVGHGEDEHGHARGHEHGGEVNGQGHDGHARDTASPEHPPAHATVALADITVRFGAGEWRIDSAYENTRTVSIRDGESMTLRDVVVRATRL